MEKKLPKGWEIKTVNQIAEKVQYGYTAKSDFENGNVKYLRITDIQNNNVIWESVPNCEIKDEEKSNFLLKKNDLVFARTGATVGKSFLINELNYESVFASYLIRLTVKNTIYAKYLKYFFETKDYWNQISDRATGTGQPNVNASKLKDITFPLPPLSEQERIVTKLDTLFTHLETAKAGLEKIPVLLKQFRQAVLTQAVTGKLTECKVEIKKLNELIIDVKYGTSKKSEYEIEGTPIFRIPNIDEGEINDFDLKYSILEDKEFEQLKLIENDVLIIRSNGSLNLVGRSAIIRKKHENFCYAGYLIRLRPNSSIIGDYLNYSLQSDFLRNQIVNTAHSSSGVNNINSQEIKDLLISIPTITDQEEIVRRVESLFAKADAIEEKYKQLKEKIENLPQAVLAKAFRGEL
jgi:type I restriction enzyme S subunit